MLSFLFGEKKVVQPVQPKKLEFPKSRKVAVTEGVREALIQYNELSSKTNCKPAEVRQEELKLFLADNNIPVYDGMQVHEYLKAKAKEQKRHYSGESIDYGWMPLRSQDQGKSQCHGHYSKDDGGHYGLMLYERGPYPKIVPMSVLETVVKIHAAFPDARFYVSEIGQFADPFLAVAIAQCELLVIEFWNEPGFRPK